MSGRLGIIGAGSMIATQFCNQAEGHFDLVKSDLPKVDVTKPETLKEFFGINDFKWVILFSAITDVTESEKERNIQNEKTWRVNVDGTKNVVQMCKNYGKGLIFISTDFVFDGTSGPYSEEDPVGPDLAKVSWYGITKIEGEKAAAALANFIILRIAYPYSGVDTGKDDLILKIVKRYRQGELYAMYQNQTLTPTYIPDIEPAIRLLVEKQFKGTVHLASPDMVTQLEFAKYAIEKSQATGPKPLESKSIDEELAIKGVVPRPKNGGLKVDKIKGIGFTPTAWRQGIDLASLHLQLKN